MKLLITGAFGNLGLMCVDRALEMGFSVRCTDVDSSATYQLGAQYRGKYGSRVEVVLGDIRNADLTRRLVTGVDAIVHNAALLPPLTETKAGLAREINVDACKQLIAEAEKQATPPAFVYPSSVTVFGIVEGPARERRIDDPVQATDNYTAHKLEIESALQASSLPWVIGRVGVSVDARTMKTDRETFKGLLNTRADNPLEYAHPRDIAFALCGAASNKAAHRKILLLGGGKSCQVDQEKFMGTAFRALGLTLSTAVFGKKTFYTHWMDTTESQAILGFQHHDFEAYEAEMAQKLKVIKTLLWPLRWLVNPLLNTLLIKLRSS